MEIRKATIEDAVDIFEICQEVQEKSLLETIKSEIESENYSVGVVESEGKIVSFLICLYAVDVADVILVATKKDFQGRGFARALFEREFEKMKNFGLKRLLLEVRENNERAINLYKSLGFNQITKRKNYYDGHIDALILERDI